MRAGDGALTFLRPDGAPLEVAPASLRQLPTLREATPHVIGTPPTWDGTRVDLPWAIAVLYRRPSGDGNRHKPPHHDPL